MTTTNRIVPILGLMVLLGAGASFLLSIPRLATINIPINIDHIEARGHTRALELIPAYQAGVCDGKWVGYNIATGIVMVSCGIPNTAPPECLVVSYRITEDAGNTILVGEAYNTTAYVDYCYKIKSRPGFSNWDDTQAWASAPLDLKAAIISAFGLP